MSPTIDRVRSGATARPSSELSLQDAAARARKGEAFTATPATAQKLVDLIPKDNLGLDSTRIEKGSKGWETRKGDPLIEARFQKPVEHPDGPFARAFLDPDSGRAWFMTVDESKKADASAPADLLGTPSIRADVVGDLSFQKIASSLKLEPAIAPQLPKPSRKDADDFAPVSGAGKKLTQKELAQKTREYLLANMGEGKLLPAVDGGNLGSSALMLSDKPAADLLKHMKDHLRGVPEVQAFQFEPARQQLFAVIDSEDEIHLHVGVIDQQTGKISFLHDMNTADLPDVPNADDHVTAHLDNFTKGGKWLSLGTGDAGPNWWR